MSNTVHAAATPATRPAAAPPETAGPGTGGWRWG